MADGTSDDDDGLVGDDQVRDELPEDLNVSEFVGPYIFPNDGRRRVPGYLYIAIGAGLVAAYLMAGDDAEPYTPVPWMWSNPFGAKFQLAGHVSPDDALTWIDGTPEDRAWVGVTRDGTTAQPAMGYNRNPKVMRIRMRMDGPDGLALVDLLAAESTQ